MPQTTRICQNISEEQNGTESKITIRYIKYVSSLLALVSAVCEENLERRLQAEWEMLKYYFAFYHINYARYLSDQQVYLRSLEANNSPAISRAKERVLVNHYLGNHCDLQREFLSLRQSVLKQSDRQDRIHQVLVLILTE